MGVGDNRIGTDLTHNAIWSQVLQERKSPRESMRRKRSNAGRLRFQAKRDWSAIEFAIAVLLVIAGCLVLFAMLTAKFPLVPL